MPRRMEYLGGEGNFGVWRNTGAAEYFAASQKATRQSKGNQDLPGPPDSIEDLQQKYRVYLEKVAGAAGIAPTLGATLEKLAAIDLSAHPIFFENIRANYLDIFSLPPDSFIPWVASYAETPKGGLAYDVNHQELRKIKDYLEAQPADSEVHVINRLYSAVVCANGLDNVITKADADRPKFVYFPIGNRLLNGDEAESESEPVEPAEPMPDAIPETPDE